MSKVRDHFIFKIESAGAVPPADLFAQAIDVLVDKCDTFLKELEATCD
jgi:DNA-directed RNA polymerase I and III subunit RPAC1